MSAVLFRTALETALAAMSPSLPTAWENADTYNPVVGTPWQEVHVMLADPRPMEMSGKLHEEPGILQIKLHYPLKAGAAAAETRAELIRSTFKHGTNFTASGVTVKISNVPSITRIDEPDWFTLSVRVPFYAHVTRS